MLPQLAPHLLDKVVVPQVDLPFEILPDALPPIPFSTNCWYFRMAHSRLLPNSPNKTSVVSDAGAADFAVIAS